MLSKVVEIRDFSIVVVADNHSPSILNPDFLKYNHIVPTDWELAMPPICTPSVSQVIFQNGVNIVAQLNKVTFWEALEADNFVAKVPDLTFKYVEVLSSVSYQAVGMNFNGHVLAEKEEDIKDFVLNRLIAPGRWKNFKGNSADVAVQFIYRMENETLTLSVQRGFMQQDPDPKEIQLLLFSSNFHRDIASNNREEKIAEVKNVIQSWRTDFNTFKSIVEENFLILDEGK